MRKLLSSLPLLAVGCVAPRDPTTIPVDIKINPKVGVDIQTGTPEWIWIAAGALAAVAVGLLVWYLFPRKG